MAIKFVSPGFDGLPDRLVLLPKSKLAFVELKAPGKKPRALQIKRMEQLTNFGVKCFVADSKDYSPEHLVFNRIVTLKDSFKP